MANSNIPAPGYPTAWGGTKVDLVDHIGPAAYVTGGESIIPSWFGFPSYVEQVELNAGGFSYSNNYYVKAQLPANSFSATEQFAATWGANASNANNTNSPQLLWFFANNNNQVTANTNLAAEAVRLRAFGG